MRLPDIIKLARPAQWIKNLFVFLPLFFGGTILDPIYWEGVIIAFISFCLIASSIYCLNDAIDAETDRDHPVKKLRPVASGKVSRRAAFSISALFAALALASCFLLDMKSALPLAAIILAYYVLNVAYSLRLKHFAIIDVFIIALGFVLRILAGSASTGIPLSPWIVSMTFLITLFLAFAKRRDDVLIRVRTGNVTRANTIHYNLDFINLTLGIIAAVSIVCYICYTVSPDVVARMGTPNLYMTSVFVIAGFLRYLQLAIVDQNTGSPTDILMKDRFIQTCIALWIIAFILIIYRSKI